MANKEFDDFVKNGGALGRGPIKDLSPLEYPHEFIGETNGFLGFFQPHTIVAVNKESLAALTKILYTKARADVDDGRNIIFGFEDAAKVPKGFQKGIERFLQDPDNQKNTYSRDEIMNALEAASREDPTAAHLYMVYTAYLLFREEMAGKKSQVSGFSERNHAMLPSKIVWSWIEALRSPQTPSAEKLTKSLDFVSYMVVRDLIYAGKMLEVLNKYDPATLIIFRGTGHIGLIQALKLLTNNEYPEIDTDKQYPVQVLSTVGLVLPILWNSKFWQEMGEVTNVNVAHTKIDSAMSKIFKKVRGALTNSQWSGYIQAQLADSAYQPQGVKNLILTQNL